MKRTKQKKRSNGYFKIEKQKHELKMSVDEIIEGLEDTKTMLDF